jgi:hypothetical protein
LSIDNNRQGPSEQHRATLPHQSPLEVDIPTITPARALLSRPLEPAAQVVALYPHDTPSAQRLLAATAVDLLVETGRRAVLGSCGDHATADVLTISGRLVLMPMASLWELDAELADEDDDDPAVWHILARDASGNLLSPATGADACPSVIWAVRAGIDPAAAVPLCDAALADPEIALLLGLAL